MTFRDATRIRKLHATRKYRQKELALRADCSPALVSLILSNRAYHDPTYQPLRRYHPRHGKLVDVPITELRRARAQGRTLAEIGARFGATRQAVAARLRSSRL